MTEKLKKKGDSTTEQVTITLPKATVELMDALMKVRGIRYRGAFIRQAIESQAELLPAVAQMHADMNELRDMFETTAASMRVVVSQNADLMRALEIETGEANA